MRVHPEGRGRRIRAGGGEGRGGGRGGRGGGGRGGGGRGGGRGGRGGGGRGGRGGGGGRGEGGGRGGGRGRRCKQRLRRQLYPTRSRWGSRDHRGEICIEEMDKSIANYIT